MYSTKLKYRSLKLHKFFKYYFTHKYTEIKIPYFWYILNLPNKSCIIFVFTTVRERKIHAVMRRYAHEFSDFINLHITKS